MTFLTVIWDALKAFLEAYGASFAVMVLGGFVIAFFTEIAVKKAFKWLEERFDGNEKILAIVDIARMAAIFAVTVILSAVSTGLLFKAELPLPGNKALAPFWFAVIYIAQYIFSMKGIKGILKLHEEAKNKEPKEKKAKEPKPKKVNPVEGYIRISHNCYKDPATGKFYNKKGEQL